MAPAAENEPVAQLAQAAEPATEKVFAVHWLHPEEPLLEYAPAEHVLQVEALAAEKEPLLQLTQALLLVAPENKPALQPTHTVAPMSE